uniref:Uncharacterized protein n=1 Tax=Salix viminalis TaxID=40686 RepID=A0A6N2MLK8_SALVM
MPILPHQHIFRLQISVHNAHHVQVVAASVYEDPLHCKTPLTSKKTYRSRNANKELVKMDDPTDPKSLSRFELSTTSSSQLTFLYPLPSLQTRNPSLSTQPDIHSLYPQNQVSSIT